jgi:hypothetical protein
VRDTSEDFTVPDGFTKVQVIDQQDPRKQVQSQKSPSELRLSGGEGEQRAPRGYLF